MPSVKLPVPRLEALLFCAKGVTDDGGSHTLPGLGDTVFAFDALPCNIDGTVYVRFATTPGRHAVELRVVELSTGNMIDGYSMEEDVRGVDGVVAALVPVSMRARSEGRHALQLFVDRRLVGSSLLIIRSVPA